MIYSKAITINRAQIQDCEFKDKFIEEGELVMINSLELEGGLLVVRYKGKNYVIRKEDIREYER